MKGKVLNTFPKIHWAIYDQQDGSHRGYLDGWFYGLPEYCCTAPDRAGVVAKLSEKLDEWKACQKAVE
jgi:hypothetical protein